MGSTYAKVDAVLGRWMWQATPRFSNELRVQYGRDFQYEQAQAPLPQEPAVGPGGSAPEVAIGPDGFTFGSPSSLGRRAYPDENKVQLVDMVTWTRGRHQLQTGVDLSLVHDDIDALTNTQGAFHYDSTMTSGHAGGLVDWITDYTFNVNSYPNGGCPSIVSPVHDFCFRSFTQSFGQQSVAFDTQEWAGFLQDDWHVRSGAYRKRRLALRVRISCRCRNNQMPRWMRRSVKPVRRASFPKTATILDRASVWHGSRSVRAAV